MADRRLHLACYDIASPRRLRAALHVARRFATGGQKSVHECWLTAEELGRLHQLLAWIIDPAHDRVLIVPLDGRREVLTYGAAVSPSDDECIVVGAA